MKVRFKNGRRSEMSAVEVAFARTYDRLRKRVFRGHNVAGGVWNSYLIGYDRGFKDSLDTLADDMEDINYLSDTL